MPHPTSVDPRPVERLVERRARRARHAPSGQGLLVGLGIVLVLGIFAHRSFVPAVDRVAAQGDPAVVIHLPLAGKNLLRPWSKRVTPHPSLTPTPPREVPPPDFTPRATRDPRTAPFPKDPSTIVLQLGRSETSQGGEAWEEMNGTPYLPLYGDGRVIAGRYLFGFDQTLFETRLDEAAVQELLKPLHYGIDVFDLGSIYRHPDNSQFIGHLFLRYGSGEDDWKRMSVTGMSRWLRDTDPPDDIEDGERVQQLVRWMYGLEDSLTIALDQPFAVEQYTIIAHEVLPNGDAPAWPLALDVKAISDSAPLRTADGNVHGPPGHRFVGADEGAAVREVTVRDATTHHAGLNMAAAYSAPGTRNHIVVGARPEVPGGSRFLTDRVYDRWYRDDSDDSDDSDDVEALANE